MSESRKKQILLRLSEEKWQQLKLAADSVEEPITVWCKRAIFAALRKWEVPEPKKSVYEPCSICGKKHNKDEHFRD